MFLCDKCHDPNKHFGHNSYGPCESCGKVSNCIDCHYGKCDAPKAAKKSKEKEPK